MERAICLGILVVAVCLLIEDCKLDLFPMEEFTYKEGWAIIARPTTRTLRGMHFVDQNTGIVVGDSGSVLLTADGGVSWRSSSSGSTRNLYGIQMIPSGIAYAVGAFGTILKSQDGGLTWAAQTSGTQDDLFGVLFTSEQNGFSVGRTGTVLKTTNAGQAWSLCYRPVNVLSFYALSFANPDVGLVGGYHSICRTTDGGKTWTFVFYSGLGSANFLAVRFLDVRTAIAVGDIVMKSTDMGESWQQITTGALSMSGMSFSNSLVGYAVGYSAIWKTMDAGETWNAQSFPNDCKLVDVWFVSPAIGFAVGEGGCILKTTTGGERYKE